MVANTRKMHEIKQRLHWILKEEYYLSFSFTGLVKRGKMDLKRLEEFRKLIKSPNPHQNEIVSLSKEEIMDNPYLKNIQIPNVSINNIHLANRRIIKPGIVTCDDEAKRDLSSMRQINSYFVCNKALRFPALVEGESNTCWMSVEPYEINSFKKIIEQATGDVLLIGCGLGYAAYMISLKEDVTSVTVVDNNQDVLDIFSTYILPQFENKDKIHTLKSDDLLYLSNCDLTNYNYINVDIWYDTIDMIYTYFRCLVIEKANPAVKFSYWLEEELKNEIQQSILSAICDFPIQGFLSTRIGQDIVRNTAINNYEDVYDLVDIKDLRTLLYEWYCNNLETVQEYESRDINTMNRLQNTTVPNKSDFSYTLHRK